MSGRRSVRQLLWRAAEKWVSHGAPTRSAAIAFYSLTSLAPVSVLLVWIGAVAWDRGSVRRRILDGLTVSIGPEGTALVESVMTHASLPGEESLLPTLLALTVFLLSATAVFSQLQGALSDIWEVPLRHEPQVLGFLRRKLFALLLVGALGVALLVSMAISVTVSSLTAPLESFFPSPVFGVADLIGSTIIMVVLFTLVFRILPDAEVSWAEAVLGGCVTGALHLVGQWSAGLYFSRAAIGSAYGAAATLVVFLTWVYYSSLVFLFGAEVTRTLSVESSDA